MAFLSVIRRWALRGHRSVQKIARRTKLSRYTTCSCPRSGAVDPKFSVPERPSRLDPDATKLLGWRKTEAGKSRKERRTAKQLHEDLVKLGNTKSYGLVAAFAQAWQTDCQTESQTTGRGPFVPLIFQSREALQFDWSRDFAMLGRALPYRPVDGKTIVGPPVCTPLALALHREPQANVERYDGLRAQIFGGRHAS